MTDPVIREPVAKEPVIKEPVIEEPAIRESVIDEPVVSEPAIKDTVVWDGEHEAYIVSGFEEASYVLRAPGWSSDPRRSPRAHGRVDMPPGAILFMDPPDHTRVRRLLAPAFTPRAVERLRPRVAAVVEAALDGLAGNEDGAADLVAELGYLVPLAVICELLDVGSEGAGLFRDRTPALARTLEADAGIDDFAAAAEASAELTLFLVPLLAERRAAPGDDFISGLLAHEDSLSLDEVLATCLLLLAAGHETTANLIGTGALALLRDPGQLPHLLADPARAVEELLRAQGPVKLAGRVAVADHEVGGVPIPAGGQAFVRIHAANRDPRRFADPDRLDLSREPAGHLALGTGPHFCLGAALARMEAAETLVRLFRRFPDMALPAGGVAEPRWRDSTTFHGLTELPVRLHTR